MPFDSLKHHACLAHQTRTECPPASKRMQYALHSLRHKNIDLAGGGDSRRQRIRLMYCNSQSNKPSSTALDFLRSVHGYLLRGDACVSAIAKTVTNTLHARCYSNQYDFRQFEFDSSDELSFRFLFCNLIPCFERASMSCVASSYIEYPTCQETLLGNRR
jgi:hypothetical protein